MQTTLAPEFQGTPAGREAEAILRQCVHCGFCSATCPTYQLLGDELDSPRGRIYLIKQVLEGQPPTRATQQHLDRCLTCRNCETTCPSGVPYARLLETGRQAVAARVPRPPAEARLRRRLREGLTSPWFGPAMRLGQAVRGWLPAPLRAKVPAPRPAGAWPRARHARRVLLPAGCVQPAMAPSIGAATARVLDAAGISVVSARGQTCCGALRLHLDDAEGARANARANIDAWWPHVAPGQGAGVEAIVSNASGCGVMLKDYGHLLQDDARYAERAARVAALARDVSELLPELAAALGPRLAGRAPAQPVAWHPPCTLQHGQKLRGAVETHLAALGIDLRPPAAEAHLCCGSAGTYSVLQPTLANALRERKLGQLLAPGHDGQRPAQVVSANIGCITHLQAGCDVPVRHWIELVDEMLAAAPR